MSNPNNVLPISGTVAVGQFYHYGSPVKTGSINLISYATKDITVNSSGDINTTNFKSGIFFWEPSVGMQVQSEPKITDTKFGDGYSQRRSDGINNQLLKIDLRFEQRSDTESYGIEHFFNEYGGIAAFQFTPPPPYHRVTGKKWICPSWSSQKNFIDNNTISAIFQQVVI